jgi:hypothetical protein
MFERVTRTRIMKHQSRNQRISRNFESRRGLICTLTASTVNQVASMMMETTAYSISILKTITMPHFTCNKTRHSDSAVIHIVGIIQIYSPVSRQHIS